MKSLKQFFSITFLLLIVGSTIYSQDCTPTETVNANNLPQTFVNNLCDLENDYTQTNVCVGSGAAPAAMANRNDFLLKIEVEESACFNIRLTPNVEDYPGFQFLFLYVLSDCPNGEPDCIFRRFPIPGTGANWAVDQTTVPVSLPAPGDYYIWVSGGGGATPVCGEFELELTPATEGCATCNDGIQNGLEEGVDCGGPFCPPCEGADFTINQGGSHNVCDIVFADSGDITGSYSILENHTITFCPDEEDQCLEAVFSQMDIRIGDFLRVYAGTSTSSPLLATFTNTQTIPNDIISPTGCLTFSFTSNASGVGAGWTANINCIDCPPASEFVMGNLGTIESCEGGTFTDSGDIYLGYGANENFSFTYCSDDEDQCPNLSFSQMNLLTGARLRIYNGTDFLSPIIADITGNAVPGELIATSGCMTFRFTSDASSVGGSGWVGELGCTPCPDDADFLMQNGSVTTCQAGIFSDSGGLFSGYLGNENLVYTYCSADDDLCPNVDFSSLNLLPGATLRIYDGDDIGAPLMATLTGNIAPNNILQSSTGCLTFRFTSNNASLGGQGWEADLFCGPCATCDDGIQNGYESGVDCGGPCEPCPEIFINEGGVVYTCNSIFYDTGGPNGNFGANENHTITICPGAGAEEGQVTTAFFEQFQLGAADRLQIRDGMNATSPLLNLVDLTQPAAGFNGAQLVNQTVQASVTNESGCLRFTFTSGFFGNQPGWTAQISCSFPCQDFTIDAIPSPLPNEDGVIEFCDEATFGMSGDFPFNNISYFQTNNNTTYVTTVISEVTETLGDTLVSINLGNITGLRNRRVTIRGIDSNGCRSTNELEFTVRQPLPKPDITFNYTMENLVGEMVTINEFSFPVDTACINTPYDVFLDVIAEPFLVSATAADITFTPPHQVGLGVPVNYPFSFTVEGITGLPTIVSGADIESICVNMEHSFMGDLEIWLVCPNGQEFNLYHRPHTGWANEGGGTDLGEPLLGEGVPGVGYDYCWTPEAELNWGEVATQPGVGTLPAGDYAPYSSFDDLIGCPVNGTWTMNFTNWFAVDDGFVFNFEMNIRGLEVEPEILETNLTFQGNPLPAAPTTFIPQSNGYLAYETFVGADLGGFGSLACDYRDSLQVFVRPCDVVVPNVISPNGDGVNDTWFIDGDLNRINKIIVFNRWGKIVFETDSYSNDAAWDGKHNGETLPTGTYFYIIEMDDQAPLKGELTIFK